MSKYTGADVERVLDLYRTTLLSSREVADRCNVGRQSAADWIRQAGLSRTRNASRQYPRRLKRDILERYNAGESTRDLEASTGVSRSTISRWINKARLMRSISVATSMGQSKTPWSVVVQVAGLRNQGKLYREIAAETGVPIGSIGALLKRFENSQKLDKRLNYKREYARRKTSTAETP